MRTLFEAFDWSETGTATMILFAVIDIVGSIPLIIQIKQKAGEIHPLRATLVSLGIMIMFLLLGEKILGLIGVPVEAFAVAGSFVLFALAIEMVMGVTLFKESDGDSPKTASIVPLAFPIIAGAGTMTSLLALRAEFAMINIGIAILVNMLIVYVTLKLTARIERLLGKGGMAVVKKVFGIILLAIAVKLFSSNAKLLFE